MRLFGLSVCLVVMACSLAGAAPDASEVRPVAAFRGIDVTAVMEVDVAIGPTARVEVSGPKDWLAKLETRVDNGVLVFALPTHANHVPKLHAIVTVPALDSIAVPGVADVHVTKLAGKALEVDLSGVGSVELAGAVDALEVHVSGAGEVVARQLAAKTARIHVSGTGDTTVRATDDVEVHLSGVGNVTLVGKPTNVRKHITGMGSVRVE